MWLIVFDNTANISDKTVQQTIKTSQINSTTCNVRLLMTKTDAVQRNDLGKRFSWNVKWNESDCQLIKPNQISLETRHFDEKLSVSMFIKPHVGWRRRWISMLCVGRRATSVDNRRLIGVGVGFNGKKLRRRLHNITVNVKIKIEICRRPR